jgi:hypothetical protein
VYSEGTLQSALDLFFINYGANSYEQIRIMNSAVVDGSALFIDLS